MALIDSESVRAFAQSLSRLSERLTELTETTMTALESAGSQWNDETFEALRSEVTRAAASLGEFGEACTDYAARLNTKADLVDSQAAHKVSGAGASATQGSASAGAAGGAPGTGSVSYNRPGGFRKGRRAAVWGEAAKHGPVIDPVTQTVMHEDEPWDMGHKPGFEFYKLRDEARAHGASRKQFLDEYNDPAHYRPELPSSNRSHKGEDKSGFNGYKGKFGCPP